MAKQKAPVKKTTKPAKKKKAKPKDKPPSLKERLEAEKQLKVRRALAAAKREIAAAGLTNRVMRKPEIMV
jgi:hypothetical protein